jgi:peptide/nickel transport system substrate-binding protein
MSGRMATARPANLRRAALPLLAALCAAAGLAPGCSRATVRDRLVIAYEDGVISLDPHRQDESVTISVLANIYEGLVGFDADMRIVPLVAQGYTNPAGGGWRFHLRPGVTFHNGERLSAGDVVYSMERARSGPASAMRGLLAAVDRVTALDSLTVEITTSRPLPTLINVLSQVAIVPQGSDPDRQAVGTGPYRFVRYLPGRGVELAANGRYWGPAARYRTVEFRSIADGAERTAALLRGDVDLSASIDEGQREQIGRHPGLKMLVIPGTSVSIIGFAAPGPTDPLADARVRRALSLAIDRAAIIDNVYHGYAQPANQLVHPTIFGFAPGLPPIARDTAAAARLLRAAGYGRGLTLRLDVARELRSEIAPLSAQLREVGIRLVADTLDWSDLYHRIESGTSTCYRMGISCSFGDASEIINDLHSGRRAAGGYRNPSLDRLIDDADREFDAARRQAVLQRAMTLLMEDLPVVPLYLRDDCYGIRRGLAWQPRADGLVLAKEIRPEGSR